MSGEEWHWQPGSFLRREKCTKVYLSTFGGMFLVTLTAF